MGGVFFMFSALDRTAVLLSGCLLMAALWSIVRVPDANFLMIVFTCLGAALLGDEPSFRKRVVKTLIWALYGGTVQFLISLSVGEAFFQLLIPTAAGWFTFRTLPDSRAACIVMLTGFLATFAPPGFDAAAGRCADIFAGALIILAVTAFDSSRERKTPLPQRAGSSPRQALLIAAELGTGGVVSLLLQLSQGAWIMLTILFINMNKTPRDSGTKLALQRIFSVPLGIILGGLLLSTFYRIDQRFIWLLPFIGATAFYVLYSRGDFFIFSMIFMMTVTLFTDLMSGTYQRFDFWESFFSRSVATLIGALIELCFSYRGRYEKRSASL